MFPQCENISIDYAIMEKAEEIYVFPASFGWSDLGTWGSLRDNSERDIYGNALIGDNIDVYETTNCIVHAYPDGIGIIAMRCRILKDNVLDIVIKDKGIGIQNLEEARRPMYTTGGSDRSGMGFTIMESFMTSLTVVSEPGKGTTVHMRRRIVNRGENR